MEQNLFVWGAFLITFLILGLQLLGAFKETRHTQKALTQQLTRQTRQAGTRFPVARQPLDSINGKQ